MTARLALCVIASIGAVACGRVDPAAPSDTPPPAVAPPNATGQVVNVESLGGGISDVTISGTGTVGARTDASGFFTLSAVTSTYSLLLTHPSFVERRTAVHLPATGLQVSLIPASFDQAAFEEFAPRGTAIGLRRWTQNPSLVMLSSIVNYDPVANNPLATDRSVSGAELSCATDAVERAIGPMSDNTLTFQKVEVVASLAGSHYSIPSTDEGTIVVAIAHGLQANGRASALSGVQDAVLVRGVVWISADNLPLCGSTAARVYPHELGHALGYQHVTLQPSVMSGLQPASSLTPFDRDALRIIYQRPPGNRSPDVDPPAYVVN